MSIVITSYNYGRYLQQCLQSAVEQIYSSEVIVVDDASTDGSVDVLRSFGSRITLIEQQHRQGQGAALNRAIAASHGELVVTLDSDDWMSLHRVRRIVEAFSADPGADWLIHTVTATTGDPDDGATTYRAPRADSVVADLMRHGDIAGTTSGLAFRRSLLGRMGEIPANFSIYPDNFLVCAAALQGQLTVLDEPLTYQRVHPMRASSDRSDARARAHRLIAMRQELAQRVALFASQNPDHPRQLLAGTTWWQAKAKLQADKSDPDCSRVSVGRDFLHLVAAVRDSDLTALRKLLILAREAVLTAAPRQHYLALWLFLHHGRPQWLAALAARVQVTGPSNHSM